MEIEQIVASGILGKGEVVTRHLKGKHLADEQVDDGFIVFTNRRFLFLQKPSGWRAKGMNVLQSYSWTNVLSVSTTGLLRKRLSLSVRANDRIGLMVYTCGKIEDVVKSIIESKRVFENEGIQLRIER